MSTTTRLSAFLAVVIAACAWPLLTTVFIAPAPCAAAWLLVVAGLLTIVSCIGRFEREKSQWLYLASAPLLAIAAFFVPWPASLGIMVAGVAAVFAVLLRNVGRMKSAFIGAVVFGLILIAQALALHPGLWAIARWDSVPFLAQPIASLLSFLGADAASGGGSVSIVTIRETYRFPVSMELLGFPVALMALAGALAATWCLAAPGRRLWNLLAVVGVWALYLPLRAVLCLALFTHFQLYVDYFADMTRVDILWNPWWQLATFAPLAIAWGFACRLKSPAGTRIPAFTGLRGIWPRLALPAALLGAGLLVFAYAWYEPGTPRRGRLVIDERHSDWEKTTRAPGTRWYGSLAMYNMFSLSDYYSYYYPLTRNDAPLTDELLADASVLVLKIPTKAYTKEEIAAVHRFVRGGGGLFCIGEHTNYVGSAVHLNPILEPMGLQLRADCVFNLAQELPVTDNSVVTPREVPLSEPPTLDPARYSPYAQIWVRPELLYHPVTAHVPWLRFEVSCSLVPLSPCVDSVMRPSGFYREDADYFMENYYPFPRLVPGHKDESRIHFGSFSQLAARDVGKGRVVLFTDSTQTSNFSAFYPNRAQLFLSIVDWLDRAHSAPVWRWPAAIFGTLLLIAAGVVLLRTTDAPGAALLLASAVLAGAAIALALARCGVERNFPPPVPLKAPPIVGFVRQGCDYELPISGFTQTSGRSFDIFYQWTMRVRYFPQVRQSLSDAAGDDLLVIPNPSAVASDRDVKMLHERLRSGRRVLVLLRTDGNRPAAQSLLRPFGLDVDSATVPVNAPILWTDGRPTGVVGSSLVIRGGTPLYQASGNPVAAEAKEGNGTLVVVGFGDCFADNGMGYSNAAVPDAQVLARFKLEFLLLQYLLPPADTLGAGVAADVEKDTEWFRGGSIGPVQAPKDPDVPHETR